MLPRKTTTLLAAVLPLTLQAGCLKRYALSSVADALSGTGTGYASDEDPELVAAAAPFGLKTMEQVLEQQPKHVGLLTALASGFTAYTVAFVQEDADEMEERDVARARALKLRARKLLLRAREYGLRGLEVKHPGFRAAFRVGGAAGAAGRGQQLEAMKKADVPLLYWTGVAWTLAIANSKNDMRLVGELPLAEELMSRAVALDPDWDEGSLHEYFVAYDAARGEAEGGGVARSKAHLEKALALSKNEKLGALVSYAENVCVAAQDKAEFTRLLERVVGFDVDSSPSHRLANLLAQRRARWLLGRTAELFAE